MLQTSATAFGNSGVAGSGAGHNSARRPAHLALIAAGVRTGRPCAGAGQRLSPRPGRCRMSAPGAGVVRCRAGKLEPRSRRCRARRCAGREGGHPGASIRTARRHDGGGGAGQRHGLAVIEDAAKPSARVTKEPQGRRDRPDPALRLCIRPKTSAPPAGGAGDDRRPGDRAAAARTRNHAESEHISKRRLVNYRMDGIQGLILGHKLRRLDAWLDERRAVARRYLGNYQHTAGTAACRQRRSRLASIRGPFTRARPAAAPPARARHRYGLLSVPLHRQSALAHLNSDPDSFPCADRNARECLSLPIFPGMTTAQADRVIAEIRMRPLLSMIATVTADGRRTVSPERR